MKIGDNYIIGSVPTAIQAGRSLLAPGDDKQDEGAPGRFDELFGIVFSASNDNSKELSEASRESTAELLTGELDDLTDHLVTGEKSNMQFELNLNIRNKVLDAYSEIMKTSI